MMDYGNEPHGLYFMIDNKSFYSSVESVERKLNPLKSILVVVSMTANTGAGLVLSASPMAKKLFGITNVSRARNLPKDPRLIKVAPRMNLYIHRNIQINHIFQQFAAPEDIVPYSIDESLLQMQHSWRLFGKTPREVARKIQLEVKRQLGLYVTVGIGENPTQAKVALDLVAKHDFDLLGDLNYETYPQTVWPITELNQVWSIGSRTASHLNRIGIHSMKNLAYADPYQLKDEFGLMGEQLFALAWGIDRTDVHKLVKINDKSWGNSQVLPSDYTVREEIELVISEIVDQTSSRMRHHQQLAGCVALSIGFGYASAEDDGRQGFSRSMRIDPTDNSRELFGYCRKLFEDQWNGEVVRNVAVSLSRLTDNSGLQLDLFQEPERQIKTAATDAVLDRVRDRFGSTAVFKAKNLKKGGTFLQRAGLVGGHNGGNVFD